uniref:Uncharacterized protein n=1 Tax=Arion vulgaris TaxID=1028688 RepID=A0A0B7A782_9EUPU
MCRQLQDWHQLVRKMTKQTTIVLSHIISHLRTRRQTLAFDKFTHFIYTGYT